MEKNDDQPRRTITKHLKALPLVAEFVLKYFSTIGGSTEMPKNLTAQKTFLGLSISGSQQDVEKGKLVAQINKSTINTFSNFCAVKEKTF